MASKLRTLNLDKAKETLDKVLAQAKESVKVLETLQKEGVARAKALIQNKGLPHFSLPNEKVLSNSLKKLGLATRNEMRDLEKKVEELATQVSKLKTKNPKKETHETEATL